MENTRFYPDVKNNSYPQPLPMLYPTVVSGLKTRNLNREPLLGYKQDYKLQNVQIESDLENSQLESIQKSLQEKKQMVDHEVKQTGGLFAKVNHYMHWLSLIKSAVLACYAVYKLFQSQEADNLYSTLYALIMAIIMLHKSKLANQVIEKQDHSYAKKMIKRALVLAAVFGIVYVLWSCKLFTSTRLQYQKSLVEYETMQARDFPTLVPTRDSLPEFKHIRIGYPGRSANLSGDFQERTSTVELDTLRRNSFGKSRAIPKSMSLVTFNPETPITIALGLIAVYFIIKLVIFFVHFAKYTNALEKQEKLNNLILCFKYSKPANPVVRIEEEKEVPLNADCDEPLIEEEPPVQLYTGSCNFT
mmetsp:Transcript_25029/g.28753  ORF Transcript_25029/g.28753 Transcript_25029/m.28753 type:complete len:360 (+) Transcript_25029:2-1081(+)